MSERNQEAQRLAEKVVSGGIVQKATERLVYQIVEVCAEHERENTDALRARVAKLEVALAKISTAARRDTTLRLADPALAFIVEVVDAALKDAPQ